MTTIKHVMAPQTGADAPVIEEVPLRRGEDAFKVKSCRFEILNLGDFTGIVGVAFIRMGLAKTNSAYGAEVGESSSDAAIISQELYLGATSSDFIKTLTVSDQLVVEGGLFLSVHSVGAITDRLIVGVVIEGDYVKLSELEKARLAFL